MSHLIRKIRKEVLRSQPGFGMVELLVTVVVLGIGIFSLVNLMGQLVRADRINTADLVLLNLSREGIELTRNIRDTNWLQGNVWDTGLHDGNDYTTTLNYDTLTHTWGLDFTVDDINEDSAQLYINEQGIYSHNSDGQQTPFSRILELKAICYDEATKTTSVKGSGEFCSGVEQKIGIEVHSIVRWQVSERDVRTQELVNTLYNWR